MKRSEIINQLLNEGFTSKTLMNFSDKQLQSLSSRINESLTVSQKTLDTDPNTKMKVNNMAKDTDVKIVPEAGVPGLKAKVVKETGVPGLKAKVVKETGVPGLKAKEVKECEGSMPGLKAKVVKETGVPGLTAKKEVKEAAGAMPGLTVGGKKNVSNPSSKPVKEKEVDENDDNDADDNESNDKKDGKVSKKQAFLDMIKKKKENKSINEWVDDVAQKHYRPFTTKNDIMEMIMTKLDEIEMEEAEVETEKLPKFLKYQAIKGSGGAAPAEPKTRPGTKTPPKQNPNERPKTPYKPGPGINPAPKAKMGVKVTPKTLPTA